jgi:hypothetical protein
MFDICPDQVLSCPVNKNKVNPGIIPRPFSFSLSLYFWRDREKEKGLGMMPGMTLFSFKKVGHRCTHMYDLE